MANTSARRCIAFDSLMPIGVAALLMLLLSACAPRATKRQTASADNRSSAYPGAETRRGPQGTNDALDAPSSPIAIRNTTGGPLTFSFWSDNETSERAWVPTEDYKCLGLVWGPVREGRLDLRMQIASSGEKRIALKCWGDCKNAAFSIKTSYYPPITFYGKTFDNPVFDLHAPFATGGPPAILISAWRTGARERTAGRMTVEARLYSRALTDYGPGCSYLPGR